MLLKREALEVARQYEAKVIVMCCWWLLLLLLMLLLLQ